MTSPNWLLTGAQFAAMPEAMRNRRRGELAHLVERLQCDHYARYHAPREARIADWAAARREQLHDAIIPERFCEEDDCQGRYFAKGKCRHHYYAKAAA